jgi:hypothetical protein
MERRRLFGFSRARSIDTGGIFDSTYCYDTFQHTFSVFLKEVGIAHEIKLTAPLQHMGILYVVLLMLLWNRRILRIYTNITYLKPVLIQVFNIYTHFNEIKIIFLVMKISNFNKRYNTY